MNGLRVVIQRIDGERVIELDCIDVPAPDLGSLPKETALDQLERQTLASGHEVRRHLLVRQWERVDQQRLLGWMTHEPKIVSATQGRCGVRQHAQELRSAEQREVAQWLAHPERLEGARACLVESTPT